MPPSTAPAGELTGRLSEPLPDPAALRAAWRQAATEALAGVEVTPAASRRLALADDSGDGVVDSDLVALFHRLYARLEAQLLETWARRPAGTSHQLIVWVCQGTARHLGAMACLIEGRSYAPALWARLDPVGPEFSALAEL